MKKITSYFMLAAASWMLSIPASAFDVDTTPTQASELTNGYYVLKTHGRGVTGYLHHNASDTGRPFRQTPNYDPATSTDLTYVFKLVKDENTGYFTLQCVGTNGYMPHDKDRGQNFKNATTEGNAGHFYYTEIPSDAQGEVLDNGILLYDTGLEGKYSDHCFIHFNNDGNESNASLWDGGGVTTANHTVVEFAFYKVNDVIDVTYNLPDHTTSKASALVGTEATIPSRPANMSFYYNLSITNEDKIISETNNAFTVAYTKGDNIPFTFSTDDSETWYTMNVRQAGYYLVANSSNDNVASRTTPSTDQILNGDADWKFVESNYGVKVANKLTGKYLKAVESNNKTTFTTKDEATEFVAIQNGSGFSLKLPGTSYCIGDHCSSNLGTWAHSNSTTDGGSRFVVADVLKSLQSSIGSQVATAQTAADESLLGHYYSATEVAKIAADAASATTIENYKAINQALNALTNTPSSATPDINAYYQIISSNSINKAYISTESVTVGKDGKATEAKTLNRTTKNDAIVPQLWKFEPNGEGGYKVINANTGRGLSAISEVKVGVTDVDTASAGAITFQQLDSKVDFILKSGDHRLNAFQGDQNTIVADYQGNHDADKGSWWKIKKVTTIPVAIGESNYATVGFPFAVTIPEGVKAFIGTSTDNGSLELTEIEGGIIPANTGAIIYHEGATTANFEISTSDKTISGNKLSATTAKREGFEANDTYVLAKNSDGQAALLKSELTTVPANKAFLAATEVASAEGNALAFHFGGTTTSVNSAVAGKTESTQYFDLQGRRVLYPSNGIFVTNNGKKVFIK